VELQVCVTRMGLRIDPQPCNLPPGTIGHATFVASSIIPGSLFGSRS
jgi:hypothetical protein